MLLFILLVIKSPDGRMLPVTSNGWRNHYEFPLSYHHFLFYTYYFLLLAPYPIFIVFYGCWNCFTCSSTYCYILIIRCDKISIFTYTNILVSVELFFSIVSNCYIIITCICCNALFPIATLLSLIHCRQCSASYIFFPFVIALKNILY